MYLIPLYEPSHLQSLGEIDLPSSSQLVLVFLFEGKVATQLLAVLNEKYTLEIVYYDDVVTLVDQTEVSKKAVAMLSKVEFDCAVGKKAKMLANMLSLNIHSAVHILCVLESFLAERKYNGVITFGCTGGGFNFPERTDVKTLYHPELSKTSIINAYLDDNGISVHSIIIKSSLYVSLATLVRRILLNGYKFYVTFGRKILSLTMRPSSLSCSGDNNVGILVRAQSEYWTVKPLIKQLEMDGYNTIIIQDDLIKNPSSKKTLDSDSIEYIPIHDAISIVMLIWIWMKSTLQFFNAANKLSKSIKVTGASNSLERVLLSSDKAPIWISSSLHSLPELSVFEYEIEKITKKFKFKYLVTMDMVDQWSAVVGDLGARLGVKTLILQNTVLDNIIYPFPVSTDYIAVSGAQVQLLLKQSGAHQSKILNFGLPIHDDIYRRYSPHSGRLGESIRVVLATQPFVQNYDYNRNLILDFLCALSKVPVEVKFTIKPHPRESVDAYRNMVDGLECPKNIIIDVDGRDNILEMARGCDLFVSRTSTALQSFILLGTLSISYLNYYPSDVCNRLDYLDSDACIKLFNKRELNDFLRFFIGDFKDTYESFSKSRKLYIDQYVGCFEGNAAKKISHFMINSL